MKTKKIKLEKHRTTDKRTNKVNGELIPLYRDWDLKQVSPSMVYTSSCAPFGLKGPHRHKHRHDYFTCLVGEVIFVIKNELGEYEDFFLSEKFAETLYVPPNIPSAHINVGTKQAIILNCCSPSWSPTFQDNEQVEFKNYNWEKWKDYCERKYISFLSDRNIKSDWFLEKCFKEMEEWMSEI